MSSLTEQERLGLEEVFLSISKNHKKTNRVNFLSRIQLHCHTCVHYRHQLFTHIKEIKVTKKVLKFTQSTLHRANFLKKKKNLS